MDEPRIVYLCDKRACEECDSESRGCKWTSNIEHAKNFKKKNDVYEEQETSSKKKQILIVKVKGLLPQERLNDIALALEESISTGMVLIDEKADIYNVTYEGEIQIKTDN